MGYQEFKLELPQLSRMKLKVLFLLHFVLISWATLGEWAGMVSWLFTRVFSRGVKIKKSKLLQCRAPLGGS